LTRTKRGMSALYKH